MHTLQRKLITVVGVFKSSSRQCNGFANECEFGRDNVNLFPNDICSVQRKDSGCSGSEFSNLECLSAQTLPTLRALSRRFRVKRSASARKAVLVWRLLSYCELRLTKDVEGNDSDDEEIVEADSTRQPYVRHTTAAERKHLLSLLVQWVVQLILLCSARQVGVGCSSLTNGGTSSTISFVRFQYSPLPCGRSTVSSYLAQLSLPFLCIAITLKQCPPEIVLCCISIHPSCILSIMDV